MPKITSIEPQKSKKATTPFGRKLDRFNIYIEGKFAFGASAYTIFENKLNVGKNLTQEAITKIARKELGTYLIDLAVKYLSFRPRSQKEVEDYLTVKIAKSQNVKFSQAKESPHIANVILTLKKYHYISDLEFSKWWLNARSRSNPKGLRLIRIELKQKGVADEIIDEVLSRSQDEIELANKLLEKKAKNWSKLSKIEMKKKVYQYLASRGFDYDLIKVVFANLEEKG